MGGVRHPPARFCPRPSRGAPKGWCVFCKDPIWAPDGGLMSRNTWHPLCVDAWKIATTSEAQRQACLERDHGICAECGFDCTQMLPAPRKSYTAGQPMMGAAGMTVRMRGEHGYNRYVTADAVYCEVVWKPARDWHADHVVPLWSVDRDAPDAFRFWTTENLATRCEVCHKAKTAREAAERAKTKRIHQKLGKRQRKERSVASLPF
jgi:hypothetical protein